MIDIQHFQRCEILLCLFIFISFANRYDGRRSEILSCSGLESMSILSEMDGGQAAALKELERGYEGLLEDNCRVFARYFKQVLRRGGGEEMILPPKIVFREGESGDRSTSWEGDDEQRIKSHGFESPNRRYNVMLCFFFFLSSKIYLTKWIRKRKYKFLIIFYYSSPFLFIYEYSE